MSDREQCRAKCAELTEQMHGTMHELVGYLGPSASFDGIEGGAVIEGVRRILADIEAIRAERSAVISEWMAQPAKVSR